jgi:hypothetical protein
MEQLEQEGVVQVLRSDRRGDQAPVLAAVGPMQFEVAVHRMATELGAPISLESLPYQVARMVDPVDTEFMDKQVSAEVLTRTDGVMLVLFSTPVAAGGLPTGQPGCEAGVVGGGGGIGRIRGPANIDTVTVGDGGTPGRLSISCAHLRATLSLNTLYAFAFSDTFSGQLPHAG